MTFLEIAGVAIIAFSTLAVFGGVVWLVVHRASGVPGRGGSMHRQNSPDPNDG